MKDIIKTRLEDNIGAWGLQRYTSVCVCLCVCAAEVYQSVFVCVCVCVWQRYTMTCDPPKIYEKKLKKKIYFEDTIGAWGRQTHGRRP